MIPTYQQQLALVSKGYAKVSTDGDFDTFKYSRKVMFDYLWDDLKEYGILECRGHVYNNKTGKIVNLPVTKTFNYLELDTWKDIALNQRVQGAKKYNGYMIACTLHNKELFVSTTGSTKSEYAVWAKEYILKHWDDYSKLIDATNTSLFEVCADWDKHIVHENEGIYFLGNRNKKTGKWKPVIDFSWTLGEVLENARKNTAVEGWMLYIADETGNLTQCCKLKTDYYVGKKKLMRMKKVDTIWTQTRSVENQLPEQWKFAVEKIKQDFHMQDWNNLPEQDRRIYLEKSYE